MTLLRPVTSTGHGKQGVVSQTFDGTFSWEPAGYLQSSNPKRGKRSTFPGAVKCPHIHLAIDYICIIGTPVFAVKAGTIIGQGKNAFDGAELLYLRLRRGTKFDVTALYYHLSANSYRYKIGTTVKKGNVVALSGNTGWSTGPHLHFELIRSPRGASVSDIFNQGLRYDPQPFISGTAKLSDIAP